MTADRSTEIVIAKADLLKTYPFFGDKSLFLDSLRIQKDDSGKIGTRAIGTWVIPLPITDDHFQKLTTKRRREVDLRLIPGHFWAEALGQTLGALVHFRYEDFIEDVLPVFDNVASKYMEAAFPGDTINLCVELTTPLEERGRIRVIQGRGAAVFNDRILALCDPITVHVLPLETGLRALEVLRSRHQSEPQVVAGFEQFPNYFTT